MFVPITTLAQSNQGPPPEAALAFILAFVCVYCSIFLLLTLPAIIGLWKIFVKAGQPGWGAIIPIYNTYLICKITGRPGWWVLMHFIPFANIVFAILLKIDLAKSFGKDAGFAIGMVFLAPVFYPILGFGSAQYQGPSAPPQWVPRQVLPGSPTSETRP
jgi:hypothetical protein